MKTKPKEPEEVEHHCFIIRLMRKSNTGFWYITLAKDAIRIWTSELFLTKDAALNSILKHLPKS